VATIEDRDGEWLPLTPAADVAGVDRVTLHRAARRGDLAYRVFAGRRGFHVDEVGRWATERRRRAKSDER
jgi:hypothetical protein